jgi:hypothetical protein
VRIPSRHCPVTPELLRVHKEEEGVIDSHLSKLAREIYLFRVRETGVKKYDTVIKGYMTGWDIDEKFITVEFENWNFGDREHNSIRFPTAYLTEDWMELEKAAEAFQAKLEVA